MLSCVNPVVIFAVILIGYLIGSIPAANLLARRRRDHLDLRHVGDRNPGYWNARTTLGRRAAVPIFVADVAKGAVAAGIGRAVALGVTSTGDTAGWWLGYLGAAAAMVGHAYPVFAQFRGGRSVLAFVGGVVVLAPVPAAAALTVMLAVFAALRRFDVAARVGVATFPVAQILIEGPYRTAASGILMTFIGLRFAQAAWSDRTDRASVADA